MVDISNKNILTKSEERLMDKILAFSDICLNISKLSYDNKYKVGSMIFKKDFTKIESIGYNGNYSGGPNERDSMASGDSGFIHAELNALFKANLSDHPEKLVLMCTWTPCWHCAKCIANSGIKSAIFLKRYIKDEKYLEIFKNSNVKYVILEDQLSFEELNKIKELIK